MESLLDDADLSVELSREKFESLNDELFTRCINTVTTVLKDASLAINDVTDVVLVGGSTRVPALQDRLKALFGGRIELCRSINPDEVPCLLPPCRSSCCFFACCFNKIGVVVSNHDNGSKQRLPTSGVIFVWVLSILPPAPCWVSTASTGTPSSVCRDRRPEKGGVSTLPLGGTQRGHGPFPPFFGNANFQRIVYRSKTPLAHGLLLGHSSRNHPHPFR